MRALDVFKIALVERLGLARDAQGVPEAAIQRLTDGLKNASQVAETRGQQNPLETVFENAVTDAERAADSDLDLRLIRSLREIANDLHWFRRPSPPDSAFYLGHANAEVIGRRGLVSRDGITVGLTVMSSLTEYPDHHHPPEELYLVLGPGQWRQNQDPWWEPGYGGYVYNPPDIIHAMRSGERPLLAIWCLNH